jgi:hypothetical protein
MQPQPAASPNRSIDLRLVFLHVVANGIWYHARELRMIPFQDQRCLLLDDQRGDSTQSIPRKPQVTHTSKPGAALSNGYHTLQRL